jgi:Outer membrane protein beta-barrel domain
MKTTGVIIATLLVHILSTASYSQSPTRIGVEIALRSNGSVYSGDSEDEVNSYEDRNMGFGFGLNIIHKISSSTSIKIGLLYNERGYRFSDPDGSDNHIDTYVNYLDMPIAFHLFFTPDSSSSSLRPYGFIGLVPGVFLNGKANLELDGETVESEPIDSDKVTSLHVALNLGIGMDVPLSSTIDLGIRLGYEYGVTDANSNDEASERFNTIAGSVTLAFAL